MCGVYLLYIIKCAESGYCLLSFCPHCDRDSEPCCVCSRGDTGVPHTLLLLVEPWRSALVAPLCQAVLLQAAAPSLLPEELLFQEVRQERVRQQCIIVVAVM